MGILELTLTACIAVSSILCVAVPHQAEMRFSWLDRSKDHDTWQAVERSFAAEPRPDVPSEVAHVIPRIVKVIDRVGVVGSSALVVLRSRENKESPAELDVYDIHSLNLQTGMREKLLQHLYLLKFKQQARFDAGRVPDVTLTYATCTECEPTYLLTSLRFDESLAKWQVRTWEGEPPPENGHRGIFVDSAAQIGDNLYVYDAIHGMGDFDGDTFDDVAVWIREQEKDFDTGKIIAEKNDLRIYSFKNGRASDRAVGDPEGKKLKARLCSSKPKSPLCGRHP